MQRVFLGLTSSLCRHSLQGSKEGLLLSLPWCSVTRRRHRQTAKARRLRNKNRKGSCRKKETKPTRTLISRGKRPQQLVVVTWCGEQGAGKICRRLAFFSWRPPFATLALLFSLAECAQSCLPASHPLPVCTTCQRYNFVEMSRVEVEQVLFYLLAGTHLPVCPHRLQSSTNC